MFSEGNGGSKKSQASHSKRAKRRRRPPSAAQMVDLTSTRVDLTADRSPRTVDLTADEPGSNVSLCQEESRRGQCLGQHCPFRHTAPRKKARKRSRLPMAAPKPSESQQEDEEMARVLHASLNGHQSPPRPAEEPGLECGCCFDSYELPLMVQCDNGHLFCRGCVECHAKEQLFGRGVSAINCMSQEDCPGQFSETQLVRALGEAKWTTFSKRQAENCVAMAALTNAVSSCVILNVSH